VRKVRFAIVRLTQEEDESIRRRIWSDQSTS